MEEEQKPQVPKFNIGFEGLRSKPYLPVGGAFGGATPDATAIVAHVYVEHTALPHHLLYDREVEGDEVKVNLQSEERVSRNDITREVQATLYMPPEVAIVFGQWLIQHGQTAIQKRGRQP